MTSAIGMIDVMALLVFFCFFVCFDAKRHNVILELKMEMSRFLIFNFFC